MKKSKCLFFTLITLLTLASCEANIEFPFSSESSSAFFPSSEAPSSESTSEISSSESSSSHNGTSESTSEMSSSESSSSNNSTSESTSESSSSLESSSEDSSSSSSIDVSKLKKIHFTNSSINKNLFKYGTGSYANFSYQGIYFSGYRAYKNSNEIISLIGYDSITGVDGIPSSMYNIEPIYDIKQITLSYDITTNYQDCPNIRYGSSRNDMKTYELPIKSGHNEATINFDEITNFFSLDTTTNRLSLSSLDIYYTGSYNSYDETILGSGDNQVRANLPMADRRTLVHNVTKVDMPMDYAFINGKYQVTKTKTYTYYDYNEVKNDPSLVEKACLVDPVDIANYYIAFGVTPCNYVYKNYYGEASRIFGDRARCVSTYTRTDGYALAVPYENEPGAGRPVYHELDVDLDGSYNNSRRGAGRLVVWEYGFSASKGAVGYQKYQPVVVYTDDHYATFREYLGMSRFTNNFDSEKERTNTVWSNPKTITL